VETYVELMMSHSITKLRIPTYPPIACLRPQLSLYSTYLYWVTQMCGTGVSFCIVCFSVSS
jgi:hypothetical protein